MHLHRQPDRAVKVFDKDTEIVTVAQILPLVLAQQRIKRFSVFSAQGDALQRVGMAGIDGVNAGAYPLLRQIAVHGLVTEKVAK